ncbi:MAG: hypothetical protein CO036_02520 [Candidatus Omnitrophica bacterium CG_4_9_14_0_2_um_filter_43_12]|nr:MAG: hypothetical protein COW10_05105 [Candidatus Omnitrophica bacterium CG12_big_fil_rev_8_21_14_0_65_42_8]PJC46490.1 MAG: hypothetical protein CO036_02520 [Candidatus Omnitrophica bacterium CG_4_9_14_0_2_um_filter_43_12]
MSSKKNISLIIGIAIPIFMIFLIAISIYLPSLFAPAPQFNFLYVTEDSYGQNRQYGVENGVLVKYEVKYPEHYTPRAARLFIHDVSRNTNQEVSFEEAQKLKLDANVKSPDGYEVVYGSSGYGFFPFFFSGGYNYNTMYLKGHNASKKLELESSNDGRYYYRNRRFLGWIR